jgi:hypothetical protein
MKSMLTSAPMINTYDDLFNTLLPVIEPVLRKQRISDIEPGPVIRDFETFIGFIASEKLSASGKNDLLPIGVLAELNARMTRPIEIRLKRPLQKSYPNLLGLFLMARASGILRVEHGTSGALLSLDPQALDSWARLNASEKYFTLLEAWWVRASMQMVGERMGRDRRFQLEVTIYLLNLPAEG